MRPRAGVALLEALCAIVVLAIAGASLAQTMAAQIAATRIMARTTEELEQQSRLMGALSLLTRRELASMAPTRVIGEFSVDVEERPGELFVLTVARIDTPSTSITTILWPPAP